MSSSIKLSKATTIDEASTKHLPLALIAVAQPGYDEDKMLVLIEAKKKQFNYSRLIVYQHVARDLSVSFLQTLRKDKINKLIDIWDGNDSDFKLDEKIKKLSQEAQIHLLVFVVPDELQALEFIFGFEKNSHDFPEETSLSINDRKSLSETFNKELINALERIESIWTYTFDNQCIHHSKPVDKDRLKNLLTSKEDFQLKNRYLHQVINHTKSIMIWQILRHASVDELQQLYSLYRKNTLDNALEFNDLRSQAISEYLFSSDLDFGKKIERWIEFAELGDEQAIGMIAQTFTELNKQVKNIKTKDMFVLATAIGNNIKNEN